MTFPTFFRCCRQNIMSLHQLDIGIICKGRFYNSPNKIQQTGDHPTIECNSTPIWSPTPPLYDEVTARAIRVFRVPIEGVVVTLRYYNKTVLLRCYGPPDLRSGVSGRWADRRSARRALSPRGRSEGLHRLAIQLYFFPRCHNYKIQSIFSRCFDVAQRSNSRFQKPVM